MANDAIIEEINRLRDQYQRNPSIRNILAALFKLVDDSSSASSTGSSFFSRNRSEDEDDEE